jgi:hypothetical protein
MTIGNILDIVKISSLICTNAFRELSPHLENPRKDDYNAFESMLLE